MKLYLIRHGQTPYNEKHLAQGWSDIPLSDLGRQQAQEVVIAMKDKHIDAIFASDLKRAQETALPLSKFFGLPIYSTWLLRERCFGDYEGKPSDKMDWDFLNTNCQQVQACRVESQSQVDERVKQFVADLQFFPQPLSEIAVVTHSGTMNHFCNCFEVPKSEFCHFGNTQVYELEVSVKCG
ncbi:histidine phosphatase family protein [bacterium]|nr:histidine phosphatase family protein [bacterium]